MAKDKPLDFTKLLSIAHAKYTSLVMCSQWPNVQLSVNKKRVIDDSVALKAELKRKDKSSNPISRKILLYPTRLPATTSSKTPSMYPRAFPTTAPRPK
eukprot:10198230-Ditylum_brightwellii.AAC.1